MKPAIVIVDMVWDNISSESPYNMGEEGRKIIPNLQKLASSARQRGIPVIFASDSFMPGDFLFQGRIKPHCLRGTDGARVIEELGPEESDIIVPKRRMSAFFSTDLDITLRTLGVDTIAVCGVSTVGCVLTTVFDGFSNGFYVIIPEDCCACVKKQDHESTIKLIGTMPLNPMVRITSLSEFLNSLPPSPE